MRKRQDSGKKIAQFHLHMDEAIYVRLRVLAKKEGRKMADLVREAVADLLRKREGYKTKDQSLPEQKEKKRTP